MLRNNPEERRSHLYYIVFILPYFYIFSIIHPFCITLFLGCLFSTSASFCYHLSVSPCCCVAFLYFTIFLNYLVSIFNFFYNSLFLYFLLSLLTCFCITLFLCCFVSRWPFFLCSFCVALLLCHFLYLLLSFYVAFLFPCFYITLFLCYLFLPFPLDSTWIVPCFQFILQNRQIEELNYKGRILDSEF